MAGFPTLFDDMFNEDKEAPTLKKLPDFNTLQKKYRVGFDEVIGVYTGKCRDDKVRRLVVRMPARVHKHDPVHVHEARVLQHPSNVYVMNVRGLQFFTVSPVRIHLQCAQARAPKKNVLQEARDRERERFDQVSQSCACLVCDASRRRHSARRTHAI